MRVGIIKARLIECQSVKIFTSKPQIVQNFHRQNLKLCQIFMAKTSNYPKFLTDKSKKLKLCHSFFKKNFVTNFFSAKFARFAMLSTELQNFDIDNR